MLPKPLPPLPQFRRRLVRKRMPGCPQHASAIIFQMGTAGARWADVVEMLDGFHFRTSNKRRWTETNLRQFWQQYAIQAMKIERGRALETKRGRRSSYLDRLRRVSPSGRLPFNY